MPMHDQVLTFFGFSRLPFGKHLKPADTFPSGAHQEALSRLSFGVADEDLLLLTGPIGCGKSVALAAFVAALDGNRYTPLYVRGSGLSAAARQGGPRRPQDRSPILLRPGQPTVLQDHPRTQQETGRHHR